MNVGWQRAMNGLRGAGIRVLVFASLAAPTADAITEFCGIAGRADKPVLLEEFGYARSNRNSATAPALWLDTRARDSNCAGWLVWRPVSRQDSGRYPVDEHDQFDVRNDGSPIWNVFQAAATRRRTDGQSSNSSKNLREPP